MSCVEVKFYDAENPVITHTDGGGCIWYISVGKAGDLCVYQYPDRSGDSQPIVLAEHIYAPGTWRSVVRQ